MISKFLFFKKNNDERFVIGPKGFNNNPSHAIDKLVLWKLYNNHSLCYLLVSGDRLLTSFTKSDELLKVLKTENVSTQEVLILNDEIKYSNAVMKCENNFEIQYRIGDSMCIFFSLTDGNKTMVSHNFLCDSELNASQKIDRIIASMFTESYQLVSETVPDENGLPPAWMSGIIEGQVAQDVKESLKPIKVIVIVVLIIILYWVVNRLSGS